ncbi:unnamed protein product, partial [Symbiodinium sp. CCMP2456]
VVGHKLFPGLLKNRYPNHFQTQYDIRQKWRDDPGQAEDGSGERRRSRSPSSRGRRALDCFAPSLPEAPKRGGAGSDDPWRNWDFLEQLLFEGQEALVAVVAFVLGLLCHGA